MLSNHLEDSKTNLFDYFNEHYATLHSLTPPSPPPTAIQSIPMDGSPQKSFTAWYHRKEKYSKNALKEYFKLPVEDFDICNPIQWWVGQQSQFPCLFQLAHDILCIPSSYLSNFNSHDSDLNCLSQVQRLLLNRFSRVGGTPSLSNVPDSKLTRFVPSCLLKSTYILSGPRLPVFVRAHLMFGRSRDVGPPS